MSTHLVSVVSIIDLDPISTERPKISIELFKAVDNVWLVRGQNFKFFLPHIKFKLKAYQSPRIYS